VPRIQLAAKPQYAFSYRTTLKVRDINYGGHLGNDSVAGLLHEARLDLLRRVGASELDLGDGKAGMILSDLAIQFVAEGYLFDSIVIETEVDEIKRCSLRLCHRIRRGEDVIVLAEVGVVGFAYASRSIAALPKSFVESLRSMSAR
jgi:acyl-CoA thioesterase FadM